MATVAMVGLGAIGASYAALLQEGGNQVQVIADGSRVERYRAEPTVVNGCPHPFEIVAPEQARPSDLVRVAVKQPQLDEAVVLARGAVGPRTVIVSLLNGISSEQVLSAAYPGVPVPLSYIVGIDAVREGRDVRYASLGRLVLGDPVNVEPYGPAVRRVIEILSASGIPSEVPSDMVGSLWWKFMINTGVNQVSAVLRAPYAAFQDRESPARQLMIAAQREVVAVAAAQGVDLGADAIERWLAVLDTLNPAGYTSMAQDVLANRPTEVETFAGEIVRLGDAAGIPVPVNATLLQLLRALDPRYRMSAGRAAAPSVQVSG